MMNKPVYYLAVDLGAESGRTIIGQFDGGRLQLIENHRFPNGGIPVPEFSGRSSLRWDVLRLWCELKEGIRKAVRKDGLELASIGIDTWGVDYALLDRKGALISVPFNYRDSRTEGVMEKAFQRMSRKEIFELTGIQFMPINSLFQLYSMVLEESPELGIAEKFLTIPDLLNFWLTGQAVCEFTNATTTQCYDPRERNWAQPLLSALAIPGHIFPEVILPGTTLGSLSQPLAEELGTQAVVVAPACHDTGSAVAAVPAEGEDFAWISSGTWSVMGTNLPEPFINPQSLEFNFTNEGGIGGSYRFSKNVMGLWLVQECRRTWASAGEELSYAELASLAAGAPALVSIVDPDYGEFLPPGDMPSRVREFCRRTNQPAPESKAEVMRCLLESIALKYRLVLERLEVMTGRRLDTIHIVGGGSKNQLLNQFTADASGRRVIAGPAEATATGNILLQALALGHIGSLEEGREVVRRSFETTVYEPGERGRWDEAYGWLMSVAR
jgi:rhamnulokinase